MNVQQMGRKQRNSCICGPVPPTQVIFIAYASLHLRRPFFTAHAVDEHGKILEEALRFLTREG